MKLTGHERDFYSHGPGDDLDYHHARYYQPLHGRYMSKDKLPRPSRAKKRPQLWNAYSYVAGNPLVFVDPTGLYLVVAGADSVEDAQDGVAAFQAALSRSDKKRSRRTSRPRSSQPVAPATYRRIAIK